LKIDPAAFHAQAKHRKTARVVVLERGGTSSNGQSVVDMSSSCRRYWDRREVSAAWKVWRRLTKWLRV